MYLEQLALSDFRSYASVELDLRPGCSVFVGPNGQGKTNLVEAVGYVATQSSHRAGTDAPLVRQGAPRAVVRAGLVRERRRALVEIEINPGRSNRARVNRAPMARAREALGLLRTVAFAPEDLAMVKGDPSERRRYLDDLLVVRTPRLAGVRADYERVLRQRNALLKSAGGPGRAGRDGLATLESWDAHLAGTGSELLSARLRLVTDLAPLVAKAYDAVAPDGGPTSLAYQSSLGPDLDLQPDRDRLAAAMLARIGEVRGTELDRRVSLVGPHRDDLVFNLGSLPARGYASHGESWSFALALRLAAFELLRTGEDAAGPWGDPVLLLDDVFAELDTGRRRRLAELVAPAEQVLVTAAVPGDVPAELSGDRYDVADGEVTRAR